MKRTAALTLFRLALALPALLALSDPALAHRVNVFAYAEGQALHVEASFQRGVPARHSAVEVRNAQTGTLYAQAETDAEGQATLTIPVQARKDRADLDILLRAGEGHQNRWTVKAAEYLPTPSPAPRATRAPSAKAPAPQTAVAADKPAPACPPAPDLTPQIEAAVAARLAPLRQRLQEAQQPGLAEIVAGIGYLVGIAGLVAYALARRLAKDPT
jgi:nickel transport protein